MALPPIGCMASVPPGGGTAGADPGVGMGIEDWGVIAAPLDPGVTGATAASGAAVAGSPALLLGCIASGSSASAAELALWLVLAGPTMITRAGRDASSYPITKLVWLSNCRVTAACAPL